MGIGVLPPVRALTELAVFPQGQEVQALLTWLRQAPKSARSRPGRDPAGDEASAFGDGASGSGTAADDVVFAAYSLGAARVLMLLTAAVASGAMARVVRRALPYVGRVSGAFLVLSGAYLLSYWLPQLAGQRDGTAASAGGIGVGD